MARRSRFIRPREPRRWLIALAIGVTLLSLTAGGLLLWLRSSLPQVDGTIDVQGIAAPVRIARDVHGVPHISAGSLDDALFGLGYAHAQDRLWQMEFQRRLGSGRIAELVGVKAIDLDKMLRTVGFYRRAEEVVASLDAPTRRALEAYAAGVNALLVTHEGALPPEFQVLGGEILPWRPADSIVWLLMLSWSLSTNMDGEIMRARLIAKVGPDKAAELMAVYPSREIAPRGPVPDAQRTLFRTMPLDRLQALGHLLPSAPAASNNWAVGPERSRSGHAMLANDPHLGFMAPSVWYLAHLSIPDMAVVGATLPGLPGVIIGRNERIAWGLTNIMVDNQDLFIEKLVEGDPESYHTPTGTQRFASRSEIIKVNGAPDVTLVVRSTRHGPVITDIVAGARETAEQGHVIALSWAPMAGTDRTMQGLLALNRAGNWDNFRDAMRNVGSVYLNALYADPSGNIGYQTTGAIPRRHRDSPTQGAVPALGWVALQDWDGAIPFEEMPNAFNPPSRMLATANHKIVADDYPHTVSNSWLPGYRIRRIHELLLATPQHSAASFAAMQGDVMSLQANDLLPHLTRIAPSDAMARQAVAMLAAWDGKMDRNRPEPMIFVAWYREILRGLFADELEELFDPYVKPQVFGQRYLAVEKALMDDGEWCDDKKTPAKESCDAVLIAALTRALAELRGEHGADLTSWRWGAAHQAYSKHPAMGEVPVLRQLFDRHAAVGGDVETVNATAYLPFSDNPWRSNYGASMRFIVDWADPQGARFVLTLGQSGNPLSRNYDDQRRTWRDGGYILVPTARHLIEVQATLTLRPAAGR